jgi:hypothetical protein
VNLDDPATTPLLKLKAVWARSVLHPEGSVKSIGINCELCHSTVDDSFALGIAPFGGVTAHIFQSKTFVRHGDGREPKNSKQKKQTKHETTNRNAVSIHGGTDTVAARRSENREESL